MTLSTREQAQNLLNDYIRNATEIKRGEWNFFQQEEVNQIVDLIIQACKEEVLKEVKILLQQNKNEQ